MSRNPGHQCDLSTTDHLLTSRFACSRGITSHGIVLSVMDVVFYQKYVVEADLVRPLVALSRVHNDFIPNQRYALCRMIFDVISGVKSTPK